MNKKILIAVGVILLGLAAILVFRLLTPEDEWLCQKGEWVKHGNPAAAKPTTPCKQ